ncbi:MAG: hypothetical protein Fur0010_15640 [Bdellovibrio sp.]
MYQLPLLNRIDPKKVGLLHLSWILIHFITIFHWVFERNIIYLLSDKTRFDCHPIWETCFNFLPFNANIITFIISIYALINVLYLWSFLKGEKRYLTVFSVLTIIVKLSLYLQSEILRANYHTVSLILQIIFVIFPHPRTATLIGLSQIYWIAASLKFNREWLSGAALITESYVSPLILNYLLIAAIVIEIVAPVLLFFKNFYLFWTGLFALLIFHAFSWHIVGYIYPSFMILVLFALALDKDNNENFSISHIIIIAIGLSLSFFNIKNYKEKALTSQGRFYNLDMFDAFPICYQNVDLINPDDRSTVSIPDINFRGSRSACDPYATHSFLLKLCHQSPHMTFFWQLISKLSTDQKFTEIINYKGTCSEIKKMAVLSENSWINFNENYEQSSKYITKQLPISHFYIGGERVNNAPMALFPHDKYSPHPLLNSRLDKVCPRVNLRENKIISKDWTFTFLRETSNQVYLTCNEDLVCFNESLKKFTCLSIDTGLRIFTVISPQNPLNRHEHFLDQKKILFFDEKDNMLEINY